MFWETIFLQLNLLGTRFDCPRWRLHFTCKLVTLGVIKYDWGAIAAEIKPIEPALVNTSEGNAYF